VSADKNTEIVELADLPYYRNEYNAVLEEMGISSVDDLRKALADKEKAQEIQDALEGIGPKIMGDWKKQLGVKTSRRKKAAEGEEVEIVSAPEAEAEIVEEGAYRVKKKPQLDAETKKLLALRNEMSNDRIAFLRQEWFRFPRLGEKWRRPRGMHSKMRMHIAYRPNVVSIGYRGPKKVRGLHSSGFKEVLVHNPDQLENIDPQTRGGQGGLERRLQEEAGHRS